MFSSSIGEEEVSVFIKLKSCLGKLIEKNQVLRSRQLELYFSILSDVTKSLNVDSYGRDRLEVLFLPAKFIKAILSQKFTSAFDIINTDPFLFDLVMMPFKIENTWFLFILDNRFIEKKGFSRLIYFDVDVKEQPPDFTKSVKAYFVFDFKTRYEKSNQKQPSILIINFKEVTLMSPFSDLFVCHVARSFVSGRDLNLNAPASQLRDIILSDVNCYEEKGSLSVC